MSTREGCRRRDSATKAGPIYETRMRPGKTKGGIKLFSDNSQDSARTSCSSSVSSLSSIEDEKMKNNIRSNQGISGVNGNRKTSKSDGIKKSPAKIKKAATLSPSLSLQNRIGEGNGRHLVKLRRVNSELIRNLDRSFDDQVKINPVSVQLAEADTSPVREVINEEDASTHDDQEAAAVFESNLDTEKSLDGIGRLGSGGASQELSFCQEIAIKSSLDNVSNPVKIIDDHDENGDSQEEEEEANAIEDKQLVLVNERLLPNSPIARMQCPLSANDASIHPNQAKTKPDHFEESQSKLQHFTDLIMWRDTSKSALVFGIGSFVIISSSHTSDLNMSFISVVSYLGLIYLAAVFLFRSFIARRSSETNEECVVGEEEAIWLMKLVLPYVNEFLLKFRALFSGDPFTTIKLAVLLFILARYGGSITIWKMAKLGFIGAFTVPKACSAYSSHCTSFGALWIEKIADAWRSCCHKKAIGFVMLSIVWNVSSVVARIWTLFILFVAFKCYQQSYFIKEFGQAPGSDPGGGG